MARELALQALYATDVGGAETGPALEAAASERGAKKAVTEFADELLRGVSDRLDEIDAAIAEVTEHWDVERIACVDRQIVRLGAYELLFREDIPPKVALNEAIELAKMYGSDESSGFVNGLLDAILERSGKRSPSA